MIEFKGHNIKSLVICALTDHPYAASLIAKHGNECIYAKCIGCDRTAFAHVGTVRRSVARSGENPVALCIDCAMTPEWKERLDGCEIDASRVQSKGRAAMLTNLIRNRSGDPSPN